VSLEEKTKSLASGIWDLYKSTFKDTEYNDINKCCLSIKEDAKDLFVNNFNTRYLYVLKMYMKEDTIELDRHKVAAIAVIELVLSEALDGVSLEIDGDEKDIRIHRYLLASQTGFRFLLHQLNKKLVDFCLAPLDEFHSPEIFTCPENNYLHVFARNLHFVSKRAGCDDRFVTSLNELDLAEKLYLLEYITLLKNNISPTILVTVPTE